MSVNPYTFESSELDLDIIPTDDEAVDQVTTDMPLLRLAAKALCSSSEQLESAIRRSGETQVWQRLIQDLSACADSKRAEAEIFEKGMLRYMTVLAHIEGIDLFPEDQIN